MDPHPRAREHVSFAAHRSVAGHTGAAPTRSAEVPDPPASIRPRARHGGASTRRPGIGASSRHSFSLAAASTKLRQGDVARLAPSLPLPWIFLGARLRVPCSRDRHQRDFPLPAPTCCWEGWAQNCYSACHLSLVSTNLFSCLSPFHRDVN